MRPYAFIQFFSILLVPLLLWLFPAKYTRGRDYVFVLFFYVGAKIAEALDGPVYDLGRIIGGHSLKHLLAAAGVGWLRLMLLKRTPLPEKTEAA